MKLAGAIEQYIAQKHTGGIYLNKLESRFTSFSRLVGNVELDQITTLQVQHYLDSTVVSTTTWRQKYFSLLRFFEYWAFREAMPELSMPPIRRRVRQTYIPYVYTRAEIRALLKATTLCQQGRGTVVSSQTLRVLILFLYATGARSGEVLALKCENLDLDAALVVFPRKSFRPGRTIPLNPDLLRILQNYLRWRSRCEIAGDYLFATTTGNPLSLSTVRHSFMRLCKVANVNRCDGATHKLRLIDFRGTFAVHRITFWIKDGANLDQMLPALAVYMGQSGLGATEQYLMMAPERFRKQLNRLSPICSKTHWREDNALMGFLTGLRRHADGTEPA